MLVGHLNFRYVIVISLPDGLLHVMEKQKKGSELPFTSALNRSYRDDLEMCSRVFR